MRAMRACVRNKKIPKRVNSKRLRRMKRSLCEPKVIFEILKLPDLTKKSKFFVENLCIWNKYCTFANKFSISYANTS